MITKYGYDIFFTITALCVVLVLLSFLLIEPRFPKYALILLATFFFGFALSFFRDPERQTPSGDNLVISPADGKVIQIKKVEEPEFIRSEATLISIFMSPINVHVNRNPISGKVAHLRYIPGKYFAAFGDKASEKNEQMVVGVENHRGKVVFKQIAGFVARRIVCTLKVGDDVTAGERFGMIKFGSRVDVFVPAATVPRVNVGDHVVAGETVLAEFADHRTRGRK